MGLLVNRFEIRGQIQKDSSSCFGLLLRKKVFGAVQISIGCVGSSGGFLLFVYRETTMIREFWASVLKQCFDVAAKEDAQSPDQRKFQVAAVVFLVLLTWPFFVLFSGIAIGFVEKTPPAEMPDRSESLFAYIALLVIVGVPTFLAIQKSIDALGGETGVRARFDAMSKGRRLKMLIFASAFNSSIIGFLVAFIVTFVRTGIEGKL
ncbi:MAG: hypothetical protein AAAFM81_04515 [Pseudomonadota bacterium]